MTERKLNRLPPGSRPLRCFIAMPLAGASATRLLRSWRARSSGGWRQLPAAGLHLTLVFLGDVVPDELPRLLAAVAGLHGHGVEARATGFMGLPDDGAARVAAARLADDPCAASWREQLAAAVGMPLTPFLPHVSVARRRTAAPLALQPFDPPLVLHLGAPRLFRSERTAAGSRYVEVTSADA
jgi:2'-5' RNA ligase